jgi:hypothetical protein
MEAKSDINEKTGKANYEVKGSANFKIPEDFYDNHTVDEQISLTEALLSALFENLKQQNNNLVDTVGIWIDYNNKIYENAIKIETLENIEKYGKANIVPIYEFFNMTVK